MATHDKTVRNRTGVYQLAIPSSKVIDSGLVQGNGGVPMLHPVYFEHWPDGRIFRSDGLGKPHQWDGLRATFVPMGIEAPATGTVPTVAESGSGTIDGTFRIYVRFVDANGNFSGLSDPSADTAITVALTLTFANLPAPTDPRVVRKQILRNTSGQLSEFYVDVDTDDIYATSLTSTQVDDDLSLNDSISLFDDDGNDLTGLWDQPRTDKPYLVAHKTRLFAGGEVIYTRGNAQVTFGSTTVTGIDTHWTEHMADRTFIAVGDKNRYTISSVSEANQTLTLSTVFRGATDLFAPYMIRTPPAERASIYYSEAALPENWPSLNEFPIAEIGEEITALIHAESFLYIAFRENLYRFTFDVDPALDGSVYLVTNRGCVGQRAWARLSGTLFILDHLGIYSLDDGGVNELAQPIRDLFSAQSPGTHKIDWTMEKFFHGVGDPENAVVRFFVSLAGPTIPRHAICYHTLTGQFWIEEYAYPIGGSYLWQKDRDRLLLGGPGLLLLEHGQGKIDGPNPLGYVTTAPVTASSVTTVTCPTMTLPASGFVGHPVAIVRGTGKGQVRLIDSFTASTGLLTVTQPWLILPDTTSIVQVGAVSWKWRSGWYEDLGVDSANIELIYTPAKHPSQISQDAEFPATHALPDDNFVNIANINLFLDHQDEAEIMKVDVPLSTDDLAPVSYVKDKEDIRIDLTHFAGYAKFKISQQKDTLDDTGRYTSIELNGLTHPEEAKIHHLHLGGAKE